MLKQYVAGIAFNFELDKVALIRKNKPEWQKGNLNGIGGKLEKDELFRDAMVREFKEETGVSTISDDWSFYLTMKGDTLGGEKDGDSFEVRFYVSKMNLDLLKSVTDEKIEILDLKDIHCMRCDMIDNLVWVISLARDHIIDGRPSITESRYIRSVK